MIYYPSCHIRAVSTKNNNNRESLVGGCKKDSSSPMTLPIRIEMKIKDRTHCEI